ncbi:exported hypothetical protein [Cupriavidus taiwanensis]|nr:exported hypothetical protein [Cupriavidus taiwanensis]
MCPSAGCAARTAGSCARAAGYVEPAAGAIIPRCGLAPHRWVVASPPRPVAPAPQRSSMVVATPHPEALGHVRDVPANLPD